MIYLIPAVSTQISVAPTFQPTEWLITPALATEPVTVINQLIRFIVCHIHFNSPVYIKPLDTYPACYPMDDQIDYP